MTDNEKRLEELTRLLYDAMEARKLAVEEADLMQCQALDAKIMEYEQEINRTAALLAVGDGLKIEVSGTGYVK